MMTCYPIRSILVKQITPVMNFYRNKTIKTECWDYWPVLDGNSVIPYETVLSYSSISIMCNRVLNENVNCTTLRGYVRFLMLSLSLSLSLSLDLVYVLSLGSKQNLVPVVQQSFTKHAFFSRLSIIKYKSNTFFSKSFIQKIKTK